MKLFRTSVLILSLFTFFACDNANESRIENSGEYESETGKEIITNRVNDTIVIGYNQIYQDIENDFKIQFDSVVNDSRCPIGSECKWAGDAEVKFELLIGENHHQFSLNTNSRHQTDTIIINQIKFKLVALDPYPEIGKEIRQEEYRVKITTSKAKNNSSNENKILLLKMDYTTNTFEGGKELLFQQPSETFTVTDDYKSPGDFGSIKLFYSEINETLFYGTIVWMGCGKISYPENWLPAEDFARTVTADYVFPANGFENIFNPQNDIFDYDMVWRYIQNIIKAREYLQSNPSQRVKLFLYQPSVGDGNPKDWKWILFLKK
jgi:hypothetical protein